MPNQNAPPKKGGGIKKGDPDKQIWIKCRANEVCEGNYAIMVFSKNLADGMVPMGTVYRYKCLTCKQPFHIHH